MKDRIIEIEVYGQKYKIRVKGEDDEKYISHLTSYLDQKMREIAVKSKSADTVKIAVLAAMNIADEYFVSRNRLDQLNEVLANMEKGIENLEDHLFKNGSIARKVEQAVK
ncbi:MAG: cell division protein ZapA [Candidatus Aminicenantes bacterium]|nr:cell division protein ZapA [Candidatus Aminicenantes bacterium]